MIGYCTVPGLRVKAGQLDQRVTLERLTETEDKYGDSTSEWVPLATVWAAVEPLVGREYMAALQLQSDVTTRIRMRYRPGVLPTDRVLHEGHTYGIESVIDVRSQRRELVLMCRG